MTPFDSLITILLSKLPSVDRFRDMAFIEIGCGTKDFAFEHVAGLGYRTFCVEPLPTPALMKACDEADCHGNDLVVCGHDDPVSVGTDTEASDLGCLTPLYLHGNDHDRASIQNHSPEIVNVRGMMLHSYIREHVAPHARKLVAGGFVPINCLKVSVNGAEATILRQLMGPTLSLPKIVVYAYVLESWAKVNANILIQVGYKRMMRLDSAAGTSPVFSGDELGTDALFSPECVGGFVIAWLE